MASLYLRVRRLSFVAAAAALLVLTPAAQAQYTSQPQDYPLPDADAREWSDDEIPAHLAIVDGDVTLDRDGRREAAAENIVLLAGDRLRTLRGRAEVLYADGSALDLDQQSSVDLLSDSLVRLNEGRMRLSIARGANALDYRVDTPAGSAFIRTAGDYRLTLSNARGSEPELDLAVLHGSAELANDVGRTIVRAGTHAFVSVRSAPSLPYPANSASWDDFDRWVEDQHNSRLGYDSARYLPTELRYYGGAFDRYGSWGYEPSYGQVWYPAVDSGWRPYSSGRWSFVGIFGWTWVGLDRWSWPTHHYGRWGYRNRWYWIPHRRWSPAWVSWAYAPGYVSWCPLGYDGRPVISITNIYVNRVDPWVAWTVVPARSFAPNVVVSRYVAARGTIAPAVWSQFAVQRTAPIRPANLPLREARPLRAPTASRGTAIPRDGIVGGIGDRESLRPSTAPVQPSRTAVPSRVGPSVSAPTAGAGGRSVAGPGVRSATSRTAPRADAPPRDTVQPRSSAPSRLIRPREPEPQAPRESAASPWNRSRQPAQAVPERETTPSRVIRSREPEPQAPRESASSPWNRSRPPAQAAPERETAPPRGFRPRAPESSAPRSYEPPAPRESATSPWMRSRPSDPPQSSAPSRIAPSRERVSPPPSSSRPSGGGWGSAPDRSRAAPPRGGDGPSGGSSSAQPSRGGGSRTPPSSSQSSGGSRGQAVRRGGGS